MKRLTLLVCLLLPLLSRAQVNTDLFDTGFHSNSAIGQLEEMSGQSISGSSYSSSSYSSSSSTSSYHSSGTTGADAIKNAKGKFKKPSSKTKTPKYRPPRPSKAEREHARKLEKWNSRSKKTREQAQSAQQRYARTSNYKLKNVRPLPENPSGTQIPRMIIPNNVPRHITLDYPVYKDTVWSKLPNGMLEGTVRESKYFAFGAIPGEEGWFNEFRFTNPTEKEITVRVEYEVKYGKDGTTLRETKTIHMPPARINEPSIYNNSLGVYTESSLRYRILNVTKL